MIEAYLHPKQQLEKWKTLNEWLKKEFPKEVIPDALFQAEEGRLSGLSTKDRLFFGFGDDGTGNADPIVSGHLFVTYLAKHYPHEQSRFVDFYPAPPNPVSFDFYRPIIKLREGAAARPKGFYTKSLLEKDYTDGIGAEHKALSPADVRKRSPWGWCFEGFQFLAIEEAYTKLLLDQKVATFVLGDYAVSPYGTTDFSSTILLGHFRGKLEIGVTNTRDNIPKYAPTHFA